MYNPRRCLAATMPTERRTEFCGCLNVLVFAAKSTEHQKGATAFFVQSQTPMINREPKTKRRYGIPVGYIGTADVQTLLNKSKATIWRMVNDGRLPKPLRDGRIKIWDRKEMLRWIDNAKFCR